MYSCVSREMATQNARTLCVDFISEFINIYKSNPALWKVRSKEYASKHLKNVGYKELIELCKAAIPTADRDFVVRKINSLRGAFRKEYLKVLKSQRGNADFAYTPNLWYYNLLMFTVTQDENDGFTNIKINSSILSDDSTDHTYGTSLEDDTSNLKSRKRGYHNEDSNFFVQFQPKSPILDEQLPKICTKERLDDEYDALGFFIAAKLRKMNETQRIHAEFLINKIIHKGLLNTLTANVNIDDGT